MKVIVVGRDAGNDVVVDDFLVSRHHLRIEAENGRYWAVDLASTNGTYVNGEKIKDRKELDINAKVKIGNTSLPWQSYFETGSGTNRPLDYVPLGAMGLFAGLVFFVITWLLDGRFRITMVGDLFLGGFCLMKSLKMRKRCRDGALNAREMGKGVSSLFWFVLIWGCMSTILTIIK